MPSRSLETSVRSEVCNTARALCQSGSTCRKTLLQAVSRSRRLCGRESPPEGFRLNVVGADALAVDLDNRDELAVAGLELRIAVDRDPFWSRPELPPERRHLPPRGLPEMAPRRLVEHDSRTRDKGPA